MFVELIFRVYLHFTFTVVPLEGIKLGIGQFPVAILGEITGCIIPALPQDTPLPRFMHPLQSMFFNMESTDWKAVIGVQGYTVGVLATLLEH